MREQIASSVSYSRRVNVFKTPSGVLAAVVWPVSSDGAIGSIAAPTTNPARTSISRREIPSAVLGSSDELAISSLRSECLGDAIRSVGNDQDPKGDFTP